MTIRFLKLSLASPESIRSWTERTLSNGNKVGKILKGDLIDYKNGLPIRDGLNCERIFGPVVSFTCSCGRFKCFETRGIHIVHDYGTTTRSDNQTRPVKKFQNSVIGEKKTLKINSSNNYVNFLNKFPYKKNYFILFFKSVTGNWKQNPYLLSQNDNFRVPKNSLQREFFGTGVNFYHNKMWSFFGARYIDIIKIHQLLKNNLLDKFSKEITSNKSKEAHKAKLRSDIIDRKSFANFMDSSKMNQWLRANPISSKINRSNDWFFKFYSTRPQFMDETTKHVHKIKNLRGDPFVGLNRSITGRALATNFEFLRTTNKNFDISSNKKSLEQNLIFSIPSFETWYSTGRILPSFWSTPTFRINSKKNKKSLSLPSISPTRQVLGNKISTFTAKQFHLLYNFFNLFLFNNSKFIFPNFSRASSISKLPDKLRD